VFTCAPVTTISVIPLLRSVAVRSGLNPELGLALRLGYRQGSALERMLSLALARLSINLCLPLWLSLVTQLPRLGSAGVTDADTRPAVRLAVSPSRPQVTEQF